MNHNDHVQLIKDGVSGSLWADFGSGTGAFTLALAELLPDTGEIYSVDRDSSALKQQMKAVQTQFPRTKVHFLTADFAHPLALPVLDGILMANSLHFHQDKSPILQLIRGYLKPSGRLILVEYNTDTGKSLGALPVFVQYMGTTGGKKRLQPDPPAGKPTKPFFRGNLQRNQFKRSIMVPVPIPPPQHMVCSP